MNLKLKSWKSETISGTVTVCESSMHFSGVLSEVEASTTAPRARRALVLR